MVAREVFQPCQQAQGLAVAFEAAVVAHAVVQRDFAAVAEGRMAKIVRKAERLDQR